MHLPTVIVDKGEMLTIVPISKTVSLVWVEYEVPVISSWHVLLSNIPVVHVILNIFDGHVSVKKKMLVAIKWNKINPSSSQHISIWMILVHLTITTLLITHVINAFLCGEVRTNVINPHNKETLCFSFFKVF